MEVEKFLKKLKAKNVELWIENDNLQLYSPQKHVITQDELTKLKQHKQAILRLLRRGDYIAKTFPLSRGQEALYFLHQLDPDTSAYNIGFAFRILFKVDARAARKAAQALIDRHAALRTLFAVDSDGKLIQNVHGHKEIYFEEIDSSGWSEEELKKQVQKACERPFDLEKGPLARTYLFGSSSKNHIFLFSVHHIIFDAWSLWMILGELQELYAAQATGKKASLPLTQASYADFVSEQSATLAGPKGEELYKYWSKQLSGALPALNLPTDHPRPSKQTFNGSTHARGLPNETARGIKALAQSEGATVYALLLTAYQIFLSRHTGQDDILIACPAAGRLNRKFDKTVGCFVNQVVIRSDFSKYENEPNFKDLLSQTSQTVLEAIKHQDYPFIDLVEKLKIKRDSGYSPLVQTTFVMQSPQKFGEPTVGWKQLNWGDFEAEAFELAQLEGQEDLQLEIVETTDSFLVEFKYSSDLFNPDTIERMADNFQTLLEGIVSDPARKISRLPLLTESEKRRMLVEWNDTKTGCPKDKCIHRLFEEQALKTPDNIAALFPAADPEQEEERLAYAELNAKANQLALRLQTLGVGPETTVGIFVERTPEMIIGLLGILKAGGAYIPLDPGFPPERIAYMLETSEASVIVTRTKLSGLLPDSRESKINIVFLDQLETEFAKNDIRINNSINPKSNVTADNLAYVMFTSGSTGKPKGVLISHKNVVNFLNSMRKKPGFSVNDVLLAVTTISFDISALEIFLPILVGGTCVVAGAEASVDGAALRRLLDRYRITVMQATPATWRILEDSGWKGRPNLKILCGGEPMPVDLANALIHKSKELWNMYGPTETTVWSTIERVKEGRGVTVGKPIDNTTVYILDKYLNPAPLGVAGSLYIGGAGVSQGYLKRPELTAEKFIPNPFSNDSKDIIYNTGDMARYLPDGRIECLGRADNQVKIRGFRIEPGEIEATLARYNGVKEAVVIAVEDQPGNKRLVAYLCLEQGEQEQSLSLNDPRVFLKSKLPDYMIPSAFVFLEALPLTPNGKVDRKALAASALEIKRKREFTAPRDEAEKTVARIWSEALGMEKVGVNDNFFEIGGNSLLMTRVHSKLSEKFEAEISMVHLFQYPTINLLVKFLKEQSETSKISQQDNSFKTRKKQKSIRERRRKLRRKNSETTWES